jgi:multidrug resistance efflux pump
MFDRTTNHCVINPYYEFDRTKPVVLAPSASIYRTLGSDILHNRTNINSTLNMVQLLKHWIPKTVTWGLVIIATAFAFQLYNLWESNPWTRDGQVRANIIKLSPQVNGYLSDVNIHDNQYVHKGDLLLEIEKSTYQLAVDKAIVALEQARDDVASLEASVRLSESQYSEAKVNVISTKRKISSAEASITSAQASVEQAKAGITSAEQYIKQCEAELSNAKSQATRARKLAKQKAGSIEDAESKAATVVSKEAQYASSEAGLIQAKAALTQAESSLNEANINLLIAKDTLVESQAAESSAKAALDQTKASLGKPGEKNVRIKSAKVSLAQAEIDLSHTSIVAPCDGYISNLSVNEGTYAVVGQPLVVVVDSNSFRVHAYFQETKLRYIKEGDPAIVTLMSHPDYELNGIVEKIGNAVNPPNIAETEGQAGEVPQIQPTFDWVRLPQRVPVSIHLKKLPSNIQLISGTTASVSVQPSFKD